MLIVAYKIINVNACLLYTSESIDSLSESTESLGDSVDGLGDGDGLDNLGESAEEAGSSMGEAEGKANSLADSLKKLFAVISMAAVLSQVGKYASDAIHIGKDYTAMMSEVQALSGATGSDLALLQNTAREYGATTVFSATEAAEALKYMSLAGWDAQQSSSALGGVLNLAAASGMELGQASDMAVSYTHLDVYKRQIKKGETFFTISESGDVILEYDVNSKVTFTQDDPTDILKGRPCRVYDSFANDLLLTFVPGRFNNDPTGWTVMEGLGRAILKAYQNDGAIQNVDEENDFLVDRGASTGDSVYTVSYTHLFLSLFVPT